MSVIPAVAAVAVASPTTRVRHAYADNLKVLLVIGVIVAHVTMAWTGLSTWVFDEPPVREPLRSLLTATEVIGAMFGMALFFLIAGAFTSGSLARKGPRRFLIDRAVRLGVPMVFFMLVLSPVVEYADPDNAGWNRGFPAFAVHIWTRLVPGPTWFLGVLLTFSAVYVAVRAIFPNRSAVATPMRARHLVVAGAVIAVASYLVRLSVPIGEEHWHIGMAQAPAWVVGFALGVIGGERHWFDRITPAMSRGLCRVAWAAVAGSVLFIGVASVIGTDLEAFAGHGTWQSLVAAGLEGGLAIAMSLWLLDVFRRRVDHQGRLARQMSRAAFAAFVVHQVVLVALVLATHQLPWPPEVQYLAVCTLGVLGSFGVAAVLVRLPGVARVV